MSNTKTTTAKVKTGEMVYGDLGHRFVAVLLDGIIVGIVIIVLQLVLVPILGLYIFTFLRLVISLLYAPLMISSEKEATIGKMIMHLKVTDMEGKRLSLGTAFVRELSKIISAVILMIGYIMAFFDPKKQALHDKIAGTVVVSA